MVVDTVKRIWLVNYYAMPPELESRLRTIKFAHYLTQMGYDVKIIASSFMHNMNLNLINDNSKYIYKSYDDLDFIHIKTRGYKQNGLARFISLFQFHLTLYFYKKRFEKPDIIVHVGLPPFGNITYYVAKKLKAKYIVEVLDLWPESFVNLGLIKKNNPILFFLYKSEKWLYEKSNAVVFSIEGGKDYIIDKKWDKQQNGGPIDLNKIYYINNGVDLQDFEYCRENYRLDDNDINDDSIKKVIYIGSIRLANNLIELVKAAEVIKSRKDVKFLLYGDGNDRVRLEEFCFANSIDNVIFKEKWINPRYVPFVLSKASVNILNYMSDGFGKYGGSQSKLFQYMASEKPICSNLNMMYCPINKYKIGIARKYNNPSEYANAILSLIDLDSTSIAEIKNNANRYIKDFDYKTLTINLVHTF